MRKLHLSRITVKKYAAAEHPGRLIHGPKYSATLLYRYLGQGRADGEYPPPSPRRLTSWITTDPAKLPATMHTRLEHVLKHCPELQAAASHVRSFAALLTASHDGDLHEHTTRLD